MRMRLEVAMRKIPVLFAALLAALVIAANRPAEAQSVSPQQIQGLIASGQAQTALSALHAVLQVHPNSGVAWYLTAEAQDAAGNEAAASAALANAEQDAPGLPFAKPAEVAALQSHVNGGGYVAPAHSGISPVFAGIIGLIILFMVLRLFRRRRFVTPGGYPAPYGQQPVSYPYGPGGGGFGSGLGGSLLGGLAAGAGFAAGERVIDDVFGRNTSDPFNGTAQADPYLGNAVPDRDDGLQGNPGWDDGSSNDQGGNFDSGNSW